MFTCSFSQSETMRSREGSQISGGGGGGGGFSVSNPADLNDFKQVSPAHEAGFSCSDFFPNQSQVSQRGGGLVRFKSAPSSFLAALMDSNNTDNSSSGDDESEAFFSALMSGPPARDDNSGGGDDNSRDNHQLLHYHQAAKEPEARTGENGSARGQMGYESAVSGGGGCIVGSYSMGMESQVNDNMRLLNGGSNTLVRQSSSPAGIFNGFGVMKEAGNYRVDSQAHVVSSANGMSTHLNFSSPAPCSSSMRLMPRIPEQGNHTMGTHNLENGLLRNGNNANGQEFEAAFSNDSWNDSPFSTSLKRNRDGEMRVFSNFNGLDNRNIRENSQGSSGSVHHLSFPRSGEAEKLLQFQPEPVPCQVRAKRGCATHPRSIAERMRRTRISERMKKLQDLFPNMDKQTSTADMLDLAVGYIKDLQKQVQTLTDKKAKCICSSKPQLGLDS